MNTRLLAMGRRTLRRHDGRLDRLDRGAGRWAVLAALPRVLAGRLDGASAQGVATRIELCVSAPHGGEPDRYEIAIDHGRCSVRRGPAQDAAATVTIGAADLVRVGAGVIGWPRLLGDGRLDVAGDPFVALRFPTMFGLAPR